MSMSVRLFLLALVCSLLFVSAPQYEVRAQESIPRFLNEGSYCQYRQRFSSGETYELYWEVSSFGNSSFDILIRSHGLIYNDTSESFDIILGGGRMVIDNESLEIVHAYYPNGTENDEYPVGEKIAFWIPSTTNETSLINSMYETYAHPTLVGPFAFDCLPSDRMCWVTKNNFSTGNWMNRYYDAKTGIVLMIESHLQADSAEMTILETLNGTNIALLITEPVNPDTMLLIYSFVTIFCLPVLYVFVKQYQKRRKTLVNSSLAQ